jgi:nucleoside-diphosphate-sugar epimerase
VAGIGYVTKNEWFVFNQNVIINSNTIKSIKNCSEYVKAFINVSTACCFPKTLQLSLESKLNETQLYPAEPETSYGWSKLMGIYETELLQNDSHILCCNLILHNVYGSPCDIGERSQVIPSLIKKAINCSDNGEIEVWGSGNQGRAFLHVDDVVKSIILAMRKGYNQGCIQIGPDNCNTIKDIAETIVKISNKQIKIKYDVSKPEGDFGRCADFSKANKILGWSPTVNIENGIKNTYDYVDNELKKNKECSL